MIDLGFLEEIEEGDAIQPFPSKAGGVARWLDRDQVPTCEAMSCAVCKQPLVFLLQVYTPKVSVRGVWGCL